MSDYEAKYAEPSRLLYNAELDLDRRCNLCGSVYGSYGRCGFVDCDGLMVPKPERDREQEYQAAKRRIEAKYPAPIALDDLVRRYQTQRAHREGCSPHQNVYLGLPSDPEERKRRPIVSGLIDYFPAACAEVAELSLVGNEQHNPGERLHWARGKSSDQADTIIRHLMERGTRDTDGIRHSAKVAWRALALLQEEIEAEVGFVPEEVAP